MRKAAMIAGGALALGAAGWSALWAAGRTEVEERVGLEIERLRAAGVETAWAARETGGFPFGYRVTYRELTLSHAASGASAALPTLTGTLSPADPGAVTLGFPPSFALTLPRPQGALAVEIESDGMTLTLSGGAGDPVEARLSAATALAVAAEPGRRLNGAVELDALEATTRIPHRASGGEATAEVRVARLDLLMTETPDGTARDAAATEAGSGDGPAGAAEGGAGSIGVTLDDLLLTGRTDRLDAARFVGLIAGAPDGRARLTYQTGAIETALVAPETTPGGGGRIALAGGSGAGVMGIAEGRFETSSTTEALTLTLDPVDPAGPSGGAAIDRLDLGYAAPVRLGGEPAPIAIRIAAGMIRPDEAFWERVDPGARLMREPAQAILDLEAVASLPFDLPAPEVETAEPRVESITLRHADLDALGATLRASGTLDAPAPGAMPEGTVSVVLTDAMPVIGQLVAAGLIDVPTAQLLTALAETYTRAGDRPEELLIDVAVGERGITINGAPFFGLP